jgi:hypothetical protein
MKSHFSVIWVHKIILIFLSLFCLSIPLTYIVYYVWYYLYAKMRNVGYQRSSASPYIPFSYEKLVNLKVSSLTNVNYTSSLYIVCVAGLFEVSFPWVPTNVLHIQPHLIFTYNGDMVSSLVRFVKKCIKMTLFWSRWITVQTCVKVTETRVHFDKKIILNEKCDKYDIK